MNPIKLLRREKKISQVELARQIGIDQSSISKWELGKTHPDSRYALLLAQFFEVSTDYILGYEQDERTGRIDYLRGLEQIVDETRTGMSEEGVMAELRYQIASAGLPKTYYNILLAYRRDEDFKTLVNKWHSLSERHKGEVLGFLKALKTEEEREATQIAGE